MTTIRASCPACGDVELTIDDVLVRICTDDDRGAYHFRCPGCDVPVAKTAEPRIVDLLVSSGVRMEVWQLPAELWEDRSGPAITHDDILDFHTLLEDDGWFESLVSEVTLDR